MLLANQKDVSRWREANEQQHTKNAANDLIALKILQCAMKCTEAN